MQFKGKNALQIFNFLLAFLLLTPILYGQQLIPISLEEAKSKAYENNIDLKIAHQDFELAKSQYQQSNAVFLPSLKVSNTSSATNNPLNAFGFSLLQESITAADFDPDRLNDPGQKENFNTRFELFQPIFNVDGWKQRKAAKLQTEAANLQRERSKEYLSLEIEKTYMQLQLAFKQKEVLEKALETVQSNYSMAKNNLDQGLIQQADLLNVEVRTNQVKNDLQHAESNLRNVSEYLSFLMGSETSQMYIPSEKIELKDPEELSNVSLNKERKDIQALNIGVEAQNELLKSSHLEFVPRANAFANYEWNDDEVFGFGASNYLFGLQLSWNLFDGGKTLGKVHQEKAQLEKTELLQEHYIAQSNLELNKAKRQLNDAFQNVQLTQLAVEQSEESLRITTNRFEQGLEKTTELLFAETQLQEKELAYSKALFDYNYAIAYLKFLTQN